jgi:hypothetical protein
MSRTWKDKDRKQRPTFRAQRMGEFRLEQAKARADFERATENALKNGFPCAACFIMDQLKTGARCRKHGGKGVQAYIRQP